MRLRYLAAGLAVLIAASTAAASKPAGRRAKSGSSIPSISNMPYEPTPGIKMIPAQPDPTEIPKADPTGNYNAYDINAYETIWFPERQPGDEDATANPAAPSATAPVPRAVVRTTLSSSHASGQRR